MPEQVMDDIEADAEEVIPSCEYCGFGERWPRWLAPHPSEEHQCEVCDELGHGSDSHTFCDACDDVVTDDHECRCSSCGNLRDHCGYCERCDYPSCECDCDAEDGEYIHSWDYQPESIVWFGMAEGRPSVSETRGLDEAHRYRPPRDSQPYLGLEIETEAIHGSPRDIATVWTDADLGWCKQDGSLSSSGVECVSYPVTYARLEHDDKLTGVLERIRSAGGRSWEPGHCGLHIHVSRPSFSGKPHQWRFAAAHEAMEKELRKMAGRGDTGYCKWFAAEVEQAIPQPGRRVYDRDGDLVGHVEYQYVKQTAKKIIAGKVTSEDRYVSVNVTSGTIELRFWRGSLSPSHVLGAVALADGMQQWTRDMTMAVVRRDLTAKNANAWKAFQTWAIDHLPALQVKRIVKLAVKREVEVLPALTRAAYAAEGGEA